jgi:UDP-N-acetylglucosamine 1-carboxyvinyltransferase
MDMFRIQGGFPLHGCVSVDGSKNASLPILAASLAVDGLVTLHDVPRLDDVVTMRQLMEQTGALVFEQPNQTLRIDARGVCGTFAPYDLVRQMRAGVCLLGPLLGRFGRARVSLPGGCRIGHRPIDLHLRGLTALGADIRIDAGYVVAHCDRLRGADLHLGGSRGPTVTGTCNLMVAGALAQGRTVIREAAREPEVVELGLFLNAAGARIQGLGGSVIEITGVEGLSSVEHRLPPDRIEAATLLMAALITRGDISVMNAPVDQMRTVLDVLSILGADLSTGDGIVRCRFSQPLRPTRVRAEPFPGLPTDVQAQLTALLSVVDGESVVTDLVFPDRFTHAAELNRLGADVRVHGNCVTVSGVRRLSGAPVMASDLRASAALVLAGLAAEGVTEIHRVHHLDRGYAGFDRKLQSLGAAIQRTTAGRAAVPIPTPHVGSVQQSVVEALDLIEHRR